MKKILSLFLYILSMPIFSRLYGRITRLTRPRWLVRKWITLFRSHYKIEMDRYRNEAEDYTSLSEFFVRSLDPDVCRPEPQLDCIQSPADGKLTDLELVYQDQATQVKGKTYRISSLIGRTLDFSQGWYVATIYLSPGDYHRFHHPWSGRITRTARLGRSLFPVNHLGTEFIRELFIRNERVISTYQVKQKTVFTAAVGATFVGSIKMEYPVPARSSAPELSLNQEVTQTEEMGRFEMGSTIILVFPASLARPLPDIEQKKVFTGEPLFRYL